VPKGYFMLTHLRSNIKVLILSTYILIAFSSILQAQESSVFEFELSAATFLHPADWTVEAHENGATAILNFSERATSIGVLDFSATTQADESLEDAVLWYRDDFWEGQVEILNPDAEIITITLDRRDALQAEYEFESTANGAIFQSVIIAIEYEDGNHGMVFGFTQTFPQLISYVQQIAITLDSVPTPENDFVFRSDFELLDVTPTATQIPTFTPTPFPTGRISSNQNVNLRENPSTTSSIVTTIAPNTPIVVLALSEDNSWYEIQLDDGTTGWVAAFLVSINTTHITRITATPNSVASTTGCTKQDLHRIPGFILVNWNRIDESLFTYERLGVEIILDYSETEFFFPVVSPQGTLEVNGIVAQYDFDEVGDFGFQFRYGDDYYTGNIFNTSQTRTLETLEALLYAIDDCGN
jgi:hypothetical protein